MNRATFPLTAVREASPTVFTRWLACSSSGLSNRQRISLAPRRTRPSLQETTSSRRSDARPLESHPMMRAPEAAARPSRGKHAAGVARDSCNSVDNNCAHCVPTQFFLPFGQASAKLAADCVNTSFTDRCSPLRAWTSAKTQTPSPEAE